MNNQFLSLLLILFSLAFLVCCDEGGSEGGGIEGTGGGGPVVVPTLSPSFFSITAEPPEIIVLTATEPECIGNAYEQPVPTDEAEVAPPKWIHGVWVGERANRQRVAVIGSYNNIAFGSQTQQTSIAGDVDRLMIELESTDQIYRFSLTEMKAGQEITSVHNYSMIDVETVRFELTSEHYLPETTILKAQSPTAVINPPDWLVGQWRGEPCETRLFTVGNISVEYDNADPTVSYAELLSVPGATFQTRYVDDNWYQIIATYHSPSDNTTIEFSELYQLLVDGDVLLYNGDRSQRLNPR